jgi:ATP-binding cassette subfamily A (ABC1) protein 3
MAFKRPEWKRIYKQTLTLTHKNFLIFYKAPISTLIRALIFPIVLTVIFCELKHINASDSSSFDNTGGIAKESYPIKELYAAATSTSSQRLVFVRNGISSVDVDPIIDGVLNEPGLQSLDTVVTDDPDDLFQLCHQTLVGTSECFAAVIFTSFNDTNVEYIIALDDAVGSSYSQGDFRSDSSLLTDRILPLQWAVERNIGDISATAAPRSQPWSGSFVTYTDEVTPDTTPTNGPYVSTYFPSPVVLTC